MLKKVLMWVRLIALILMTLSIAGVVVLYLQARIEYCERLNARGAGPC